MQRTIEPAYTIPEIMELLLTLTDALSTVANTCGTVSSSISSIGGNLPVFQVKQSQYFGVKSDEEQLGQLLCYIKIRCFNGSAES